MNFTFIVNQVLSALTIGGQIIIVLLVVFLLARRKNASATGIKFIAKYGIAISFFTALVAVSGSLFYSEIAGYELCKLCWFQRIFMYPQVIILGLALWKKDKGIAYYALILTLLGTLIAGYHYLLQVGVAQSLPCSAVGYSVSCSQRFVMQFGYITIPMMALTAFLLIAVLMVGLKIALKNPN